MQRNKKEENNFEYLKNKITIHSSKIFILKNKKNYENN